MQMAACWNEVRFSSAQVRLCLHHIGVLTMSLVLRVAMLLPLHTDGSLVACLVWDELRYNSDKL